MDQRRPFHFPAILPTAMHGIHKCVNEVQRDHDQTGGGWVSNVIIRLVGSKTIRKYLMSYGRDRTILVDKESEAGHRSDNSAKAYGFESTQRGPSRRYL